MAIGDDFPVDPEWDNEKAADFLKLERSYDEGITNEQMTRKILEDAAPAAAMRIVHIATHGSNENTALRASQYITDYMLQDQTDDGKASWEKLIGDVVEQVEVFANAHTDEA
jgi:CHAT domain-containing protein